MRSLWDSPLAISLIAAALGAVFAAVVYSGDLIGSLIFGGCVGLGAFFGQGLRLRQERDDERRADVDGPDDT